MSEYNETKNLSNLLPFLKTKIRVSGYPGKEGYITVAQLIEIVIANGGGGGSFDLIAAINAQDVAPLNSSTGDFYFPTTGGKIKISDFLDAIEGAVDGDVPRTEHTLIDVSVNGWEEQLFFKNTYNDKKVGVRYTYDFTSITNATPLVVGKYYQISDYQNGDDFTNVADVQSGTINTNGCIFIATGDTPTNWSNNTGLKLRNDEPLATVFIDTETNPTRRDFFQLTVDTQGNIWKRELPKEFSAVISQANTDDPIVEYLRKDDFDDITLTRQGVGMYKIESAGGQFGTGNTTSLIWSYYNINFRTHITTSFERDDNYAYLIRTYDSSGVLADGQMTPIEIKITVYTA